MKDILIQLIMSMLAALSFAIIFNVHGKKLIIIFFGGALNWGAYLLTVYLTDSRIMGFFIATVATTLLAEVSARIIKTPVIVLLVPTLIPLLPGGDLFYTMQHLLFGRMENFAFYGQQVLTEAAAMAFGILLVTTVVQLITRLLRYGKKMNVQQ